MIQHFKPSSKKTTTPHGSQNNWIKKTPTDYKIQPAALDMLTIVKL